LQRQGVRVVIWDVSRGADVYCDVGDSAAVAAAAEWTRQHAGPASLLVASAGVAGGGSIIDMQVEDWDRVLAVNLRGVMLTMQAVARQVRASGGGGSFVAVSSVNGVVADPGLAAYSASKAGVFHLTRVAARELGPLGIRVNAVGPGPTETPMLQRLTDDPAYRQEAIERSPLGDVGTPERIGDAIVGLMQMEWVTGQALMVDGGTSLTTGRSTRWHAEAPAPSATDSTGSSA
jgi:NAD(P)-dependent dehydrogenase (short-subunit alcohol dehydrogenase family)